MTRTTTRRTVLSAIAAAPLAAVPVVAFSSKSPLERIKDHVDAISKFLVETTPEGFKPPREFAVIGGDLMGMAFPLFE